MERTEPAHGGNEPLGKGLAVRLNSCADEASSIYLLQPEAAHDGTSLSEYGRSLLGEKLSLF
ncbi:hypothetical protein EYF80_021440 [Liparis tanakae]|uniref:Uncharacterized protein n=1 Tax=Liparis tanakae TaxID=230148 RepID=A0A4Z2HRQ8_9TELE|nr:hypothetical protein EYF80_021440 [Liparis tanakae]